MRHQLSVACGAVVLASAGAGMAGTVDQVGTKSTWGVTWHALSGVDEGTNAGVTSRLDFVGNASNPGGYWAKDADYVYFRMRVAETGTIVANTFSDTLTVLIDLPSRAVGSTYPDYGFAWDSKSNDIAKHGLEMQINSAGTTWDGIKMDDIDLDASVKTIKDINGDTLKTDGYVRTIDAQAAVGTGLATTAFVDFAVSWNYLSNTSRGNTELTKANFASWNIAFASIANATDHNSLGLQGDISGGADPASSVSVGWATLGDSVYTGLSTWTGTASNKWNSFDNWDAVGGVPGLDATRGPSHDTATFSGTGATITLDGVSPSLNRMTLSNGSYTIAQGTGGSLRLSGTGAAITSSGTQSITAPVVLDSATQVGVTNLTDVLSISGDISGASGLTKTGAGTLILSGDKAYTGATAVDAGMLTVNGSLETSAVTIATGARLTGTDGSVAGTLTVSGTIAPGDPATVGSISTLTALGTETWAGGVYEADIASTTSDRLVMGSLEMSRNLTIVAQPTADFISSFTPGSPTTIYDWVIASVTGSGQTFGSISGLTLDTSLFAALNKPNMESYHFSLYSGSGSQNLVLRYNYNAVPEATTLLLGIAGLAPLLLQRRRSVAGRSAAVC